MLIRIKMANEKQVELVLGFLQVIKCLLCVDFFLSEHLAKVRNWHIRDQTLAEITLKFGPLCGVSRHDEGAASTWADVCNVLKAVVSPSAIPLP
jgi:hypothetical protein